MDENNNSRNLHFVVSFLMNKEAKKTKPTPKAGWSDNPPKNVSKSAEDVAENCEN